MTEEIHDKEFETLFEVRLYVEGDVAFVADESAFTLEPDEVVALMQLIRPHQVWTDANEQTLNEPWYKAFRKLKETGLYEQRTKKEDTVEDAIEIICHNAIETNWIVRAIAKKLDLDVDAIIEAEANPP